MIRFFQFRTTTKKEMVYVYIDFFSQATKKCRKYGKKANWLHSYPFNIFTIHITYVLFHHFPYVFFFCSVLLHFVVLTAIRICYFYHRKNMQYQFSIKIFDLASSSSSSFFFLRFLPLYIRNAMSATISLCIYWTSNFCYWSLNFQLLHSIPYPFIHVLYCYSSGSSLVAVPLYYGSAEKDGNKSNENESMRNENIISSLVAVS